MGDVGAVAAGVQALLRISVDTCWDSSSPFRAAAMLSTAAIFKCALVAQSSNCSIGHSEFDVRLVASECNAVVDRLTDFLLRTQIQNSSGYVLVTKKFLDLLDIASRLAAELSGGSAQVVRTEVLNSRNSGRSHDRLPHGPCANRRCKHVATLEQLTKRKPLSIPAAASHPSRASLAVFGIETVLTRPHLPMRSAITQRPSRF